MKRTQRGFTIVELLIVIVVIAILAAITIVAYNGIQARAKESKVQADMANIQKKIEIFNVENDRYPSINEMIDAAFRRDKLGLADTVVTSPKGVIIDYCWSDNPSNKDSYCYVAFLSGGWAANGSDCLASGADCIGYTLNYWSAVKGARIDISGGSSS